MKKKLLSLALALAMCLGLTVPAFAADTKKVVVDETHGVKITLNGFLREETHRYNREVWYDEDTDELMSGMASEFTIYVVADNSTVTVEALEGRKYADPGFVETMKDYNRYQGFPAYNSPEYEAYKTFGDNIDQYAYESTYNHDWDPENKCFYDFGGPAWPLEKATTYTVSPTTGEYASFVTLNADYDISWLCESDYAKLAPATLQASGWARAEVEKAYDALLVPFNPYVVDCTKGMTRDEFAATAVRLYAAMLGTELDADSEHPFTDVDWETTSYEDEVGMAYNLGFVQGKGGNLFKPKDTLTRQEAAVMLARVHSKVHGDIPKVSNTAFADDKDVNSWAKSEVVFMAGKEIVKGVGENRFAPTETLSIQEAVIMANRMLENLK